MAQALAQEGELVKSLEAVDEKFVRLRAEGHPFAAWANLQVHHFVWVWNLGNWLRLVAIPEEDWTAGAGRHELKLVVTPLAHRRVEAVARLAHLQTLLLLQVVGAQAAISAARVNHLLLVHVWEQSDDLALLVYKYRKRKLVDDL